jgi:FSR family fosmidomycin resistance protein-like MFS transporter
LPQPRHAVQPVPDAVTQERARESERFEIGQVLTISGGHAVHDTYTGALPALLPVLIEKFFLSKAEAGLLTAFTQFPSIFQPLIGHLADNISLRYLVILAPGITGSMMSLLGVAQSYLTMAVAITIAGLSSAGIHAVGPVMTGRVSGKNLGRGMSFWMVGGELGRTLGPVAVVSAIAAWTLAGTPWLMVGGWIASLVLFMRMRKISGRRVDRSQALPWRQALSEMRSFLLPLGVFLTVSSFMSVALTTYLPTFLREEGASLWLAGASLTILEGAGVLGALVGGSISDRLGRRSILAVSLAVSSALLFAFMALDGWTRTALLPLLGFMFLARVPVIMAVVQESYPQNRAFANGIYMALSFLIRSVILVLFGAVSDLLGLRWSFLFSGVLLLVGLPMVMFFPKAHHGVDQEQQYGN